MSTIASEILNIAMVQSNIAWLDKTQNIKQLDELLASQDLHGTDLLLLPETFTTGFAIDEEQVVEPAEGGQVLSWMKSTAHQLNLVIAGSVLVRHGNKKHNRFYWVWPNGDVQYYNKRHLFRLGNEQDHIEAGQSREVFVVKGVRILPLVCYDLRFPVWARNRNDYDLMINVANWPAVRRKVWDTLLQARAMENQSYVIGVNRVGEDGKGTQHSGGTACYDYKGDTIVQAPDHQQQVVSCTINLSKLERFKAGFPAHLDADDFSIEGI